MKTKMMLIVGLILLSFTACDKEKLKGNEVYRDNDFSIEFTNFNDSRCPYNVDCVWAGQAEVFLTVNSGSQSVNFWMKGLGRDTTLFNHKIEFVDLLPYPVMDDQTTLEDKEVVLNVTAL